MNLISPLPQGDRKVAVAALVRERIDLNKGNGRWLQGRPGSAHGSSCATNPLLSGGRTDMLYTISYDIPDDKRRLKIAKILLDYGPRVQYSVFEAELDADTLDQLRTRIKSEVDLVEDSVRIYPHCAACEARIEIIGQGTVSQDPAFIII